MEWLRGKNSLGGRIGKGMEDLMEQAVVCEVFVVIVVLSDDAVSAWEELDAESESILVIDHFDEGKLCL
jgi:hypothetical protein